MTIRDEALFMLDKRGAILDTAREVSRLMRDAGILGVVIGGVAVVLHGHVRTTNGVDVLLEPPLERLAELLTAGGFAFDREKREFVKNGVPVQLVLPDHVGTIPASTVDMEGITTVPLATLVDMKQRSGTADLLRAQDLADVIGLIRHHGLTSEFAKHLDRTLRPAFRKLVRAIQRRNPLGERRRSVTRPDL